MPACETSANAEVAEPPARQRSKRSVAVGSTIALLILGAIVPACSLGEGKGDVNGELNIPDCWAGQFNLNPDFFAAVPYRSQLILRIQNGSDYQSFADGLSIQIDDLNKIQSGLLGQKLEVSISAGVSPPGVPLKAVPNPAIVHSTLYLQRSCRVQNVALYAVDQVTLNSQGNCADEPTDAGNVPTAGASSACGATSTLPPDDGGVSDGGVDAGAEGGAPAAGGAADASSGADASVPASSTPNVSARSWILFRSLFDGNPDESDASKRLNDADFEFFLADPRETCPGGFGPPPPCRGHIKGTFKFYFERGRPAQPFP
jgi:hypothetical protein